MPNQRIYFDHSSTTNIHPDVLETYIELLKTHYANSESLYDEGSEIARMMEKARASIAGLLGIHNDEVLFTGSSSESNSLAIKGVAFTNLNKKHIITTQVEHSSILNACEQLQRVFGYEITYLPVNQFGVVSLEDLKAALREDTMLVSIMHVNNEVGTVNPIKQIAEYVKTKSHAYFHVDMTQSIGKIPVDLTNIDLASISAHKIEGLKGSAILIKKKHVPMEPLINGGEQEYGLRGGISNAVVNMVFTKTLRLALENETTHYQYVQSLHDYFMDKLNDIPGIEFNTNEFSIPHIINFSYEPIPSEVMQNALNQRGFLVSARSTCDSKSINPSHVLKAMGFSDKRASSCIRLSISHENTLAEIDAFIDSLKEIIQLYGE